MTTLLKTRTILTMKQEIDDINHRHHQQHFPNLFGGQTVRLRNYSVIEIRNIYYNCSLKYIFAHYGKCRFPFIVLRASNDVGFVI